MKSFADMTEPEIRSVMTAIANEIKRRLPRGELFCLVTFGEDGIGQYVANAQRRGVIDSLREFADRLESREDVTR